MVYLEMFLKETLLVCKQMYRTYIIISIVSIIIIILIIKDGKYNLLIVDNCLEPEQSDKCLYYFLNNQN